MEQPLVVRSPHLTLNDSQERLINRLAQKLERFFPHVVSCEVSIEPPPHNRGKGKPYLVRIDIGVPGPDLHIREKDETDLDRAIRAAFDTADRQLEDYSQLRRGDVKRHEPGPREIQT